MIIVKKYHILPVFRSLGRSEQAGMCKSIIILASPKAEFDYFFFFLSWGNITIPGADQTQDLLPRPKAKPTQIAPRVPQSSHQIDKASREQDRSSKARNVMMLTLVEILLSKPHDTRFPAERLNTELRKNPLGSEIAIKDFAEEEQNTSYPMRCLSSLYNKNFFL